MTAQSASYQQTDAVICRSALLASFAMHQMLTAAGAPNWLSKHADLEG